MLIKWLSYYLVAVNSLSLIFYGVDKMKAMLKFRRIPEKVLLSFSLIGGAYGSFFGMYLFHHKIRKKVFIIVNYLCVIGYSIFLYMLWRYV